MSEELPSGWQSAALRDIAEIVGGVTKDAKKSAGTGFREVPYLRVANVQRGWLDLTEVKLIAASEADIQKLSLLPGDILLNEGGDRDKLGRGWIWQGQLSECIHQNHVFRARLLSRDIDPVYVAHFTNSVAQTYFATHGSQTTNLASISLTKLGSLPIRLPPAAEQTRIVAKLEELLSDLDAGVAELKAAQAKLQHYRQSLLKAAVEGSLTRAWREAHPAREETGADLLARILRERRARWEARQLAKFEAQGKAPTKGWQGKYPEPVTPQATDLPDLPLGWVWASVDQCALDDAAITDGPFGSNLKSAHYQQEGPRVIRLQNIGDGFFVDARASISQAHFEQLQKHSVEQNDVVVAMLGEALPRACVVPDGVAPAIVKADCARIRLNAAAILPELLVAQMNSKPIRDAVSKLVKGIGRPRINLGHIRSMPVALASVDEQAEAMRTLRENLRAVDDQEQAIKRALAQSTAQRQNLLRAAFAGQLVPQDPADEPAAELLARIRAERAAAQPVAKRSRSTKKVSA